MSLALPLILASILGADLPADFKLPPPPGKIVAHDPAEAAKARSVAAGTPLIVTTYFYWYDAQSKAHVINPDGSDALTDHPPTLDGFSWKNAAWHKRQLEDMIAAGIDAAIPVYWGAPDASHSWSDEGLPPLVAAREQLVTEGKQPPAIGMFYDTSTLQHNARGYHVDLTTPAGRLWFYGTIRDFFSRIPERHRMLIDGKPLVFLYALAFAKKADAELFPAAREMFQKDFGADVYLVKMRGWPGKAESEYQWGAALEPQILATAALGPGYDHSAVPGRTPLVRKREDGKFYRAGWERLLRMDPATRPWLLHLETWNELHEGTDICESREYGRRYIELTRKFAERFHARKRIE